MKKIVKLLALMAAAAALFTACPKPTGTSEPAPAPATPTVETVVLTEKYAAWSQLPFAAEYAKLTDAQKAGAKVVIEVSDADGVQANWGYGAAWIWHSWADGDASQSEKLLLKAPADATATGFTVEWAVADIVAEYNSDSDVGLGLNFWGALTNATIKVSLVYTK